MASLIIIRLSIPTNPNEPGLWLANPDVSFRILMALNMVPFAGIAFLWFIGVIRDLIGEMEDKFFATVFLGSGLLFIAMLFASAAVAGGILASFSTMSREQVTANFSFGRSLTYVVLNIFAMKMAGVFMISTFTIGLRTERIPTVAGHLGVHICRLAASKHSLCRIDRPAIPIVDTHAQHQNTPRELSARQDCSSHKL
jgi:hypothetical protein